jgi:hypothetical protein
MLKDRLLLGAIDTARSGWGQSLAANAQEKDGIAGSLGRGQHRCYPKAQ